MVAVPVLAGAVLRVVNGVLVDRIGPKRTGDHRPDHRHRGLLRGLVLRRPQLYAGRCCSASCSASPAPPSPSPCRWPPAGIRRSIRAPALGIAGAGNSGTVLAALFAPGLAMAFGWNTVLGLAAMPLAVVFVVYCCWPRTRRTARRRRRWPNTLGLLQIGDAWWFMFFYAVTFGGFVGLSSSLTIYFNDEFGLTRSTAGYFTAACVFAGSLVRPVGGALADRIGGVRTLTVLYARGRRRRFGRQPPACRPPGWRWPVFVLAMLALGMGNGAVFQLVPQRFRTEIGVMTGLVGMTGGVGGFYLASRLGFAKQSPAATRPGFLVFAALAAVALVGLSGVDAPLAHHLGRRLRRGPRLRSGSHEHARPQRSAWSSSATAWPACRTVEEILEARAARYEIAVFGAEPHGNYDRIMLSPVLAGEKTLRATSSSTRRTGTRQRHRADRRRRRGRDRPLEREVRRRPASTRRLRPAAAGDRLEPVRAADARARTCPAWSPSATSTTSRRCWPRPSTDKRARGDRRRAARAGSGLWPDARGMAVTLVHLMPTLMERQLDP